MKTNIYLRLLKIYKCKKDDFSIADGIGIKISKQKCPLVMLAFHALPAICTTVIYTKVKLGLLSCHLLLSIVTRLHTSDRIILG